MKHKIKFFLLAISFVLFQNCSSSRVQSSWKAETSTIELFKQKNVLVIARTANLQARVSFETEIANALSSHGIKATESYKKAPKIYPNREISEEQVEIIKNLLESEGYNSIVLTVIKDVKETVRTSTTSASAYYGGYPNHYGGFYNYYSYPYAYGPYYSSFGAQVPLDSTTYTETDYVLETVAYNLDEEADKQLVAVVTISLDDPKEAHKTAENYVKSIIKEFKEEEKK